MLRSFPLLPLYFAFLPSLSFIFAAESLHQTANYCFLAIVNMNSIYNQASFQYPNIQNRNEDICSQIYSHMLDVDHIISQHICNTREEILQKKRKFSSQIMSVMGETLSKRLKAKDEEIIGLKRINYAMLEKIKNLEMENNAWKFLAQSHETTAAALNENLKNVLEQNEKVCEDDCESSCGDNYETSGLGEKCKFERKKCLSCKIGEPSVLLLPCRHLCLCMVCGPGINVCPICNSEKSGSVNVNLW